MKEKYIDLDKQITKEVMDEFKGKVVDSICPDCNGETAPKVGDIVLYQYTHHLNSRSTTQIVKEGVLVGIGRTKKMFLADHGQKVGIVRFSGNKTNSRVPFHQLQKKEKCERCNGEGHYNIQY